MGGKACAAAWRAARRLSQQLCLFRPALSPRLRRLRGAQARRAAPAVPYRYADRHDARARSENYRAPAARAGEEHSLSRAAHRRHCGAAGGIGRRPAGRGRLHLAVRRQRRGAVVGAGRAMTDALTLLWPTFLVAFCLVGIHAYFGIQVLARNVVFVDLALAQIAALGATVSFMLGHPAQGMASYAYSLGFTLIAAALIAATRAWSQRISQEALIGVIYVAAAAAAI